MMWDSRNTGARERMIQSIMCLAGLGHCRRRRGGPMEREIRRHARCIYILSYTWKLMSFATCQSLINSSPSASKQPEALQERQARAGGVEVVVVRKEGT